MIRTSTGLATDSGKSLSKHKKFFSTTKFFRRSLIFTTVGLLLFLVLLHVLLISELLNTNEVYTHALLLSNFKIHIIPLTTVIALLPGFTLAYIAFEGLKKTTESLNDSRNIAEANKNANDLQIKKVNQQATIEIIMKLNGDRRLQKAKDSIYIIGGGQKLIDYYENLDTAEDKEEHKQNIIQSTEKLKNDLINNNYCDLESHYEDLLAAEKKRTEYLKESLKAEEKKGDLLYIINFYEFISLGLYKEAFDEELFKELHYSSYMKFYRHVCGLIGYLRVKNNQSTLYQEMQRIYNRWLASPIKQYDEIENDYGLYIYKVYKVIVPFQQNYNVINQ